MATKLPNSLQSSAPISVKDFGAVGDGVTDDTAAVLAAFNKAKADNGGTIIFPNGDYRFNLDISGANPIIEFVGIGSVTFRPFISTTDNPSVLSIIYANNGGSLGVGSTVNCTFRNIQFTGRWVGDVDPQYGRVDSCVRYDSCWGDFYDCSFSYGINAGFRSLFGQYNEFYSCTFSACVAGAASTGCLLESNTVEEAANENTFVRCRFNTNKNGLIIKGGINNRIYGCQFQTTLAGGGACLTLRDDDTGFGVSGAIVSGCYFEFNPLNVEVGVATDVTFQSCSFVGGAFTSTHCYNLSILGCNYYGAPADMTLVHPSSNTDVASLTMLGNNFEADISGLAHVGKTVVNINDPAVVDAKRIGSLEGTGKLGVQSLKLHGGNNYLGFKTSVARTVATDFLRISLDTAASAASRTFSFELVTQTTIDVDASTSVGYATRIDKHHVHITCNTSGSPQVFINTIGTGVDTGVDTAFSAVGPLTLSSSVASDQITFSGTWSGAGSSPTIFDSATIGWTMNVLAFGGAKIEEL